MLRFSVMQIKNYFNQMQIEHQFLNEDKSRKIKETSAFHCFSIHMKCLAFSLAYLIISFSIVSEWRLENDWLF